MTGMNNDEKVRFDPRLRRDLQHFRKRVDKKRVDEEVDGGWTYIDSQADDYEQSFRNLLDQLQIKSFSAHLEQRRRDGKGTFVLDIMGGDDSFLRNLPDMDGGIAISFTDARDNGTKEEDAQKKIDIITGDIAKKTTWRKIKGELEIRNVNKADLIVCRGVAGVLDVSQAHYHRIFQSAWDLLSDDGGLLITQIPGETYDFAKCSKIYAKR